VKLHKGMRRVKAAMGSILRDLQRSTFLTMMRNFRRALQYKTGSTRLKLIMMSWANNLVGELTLGWRLKVVDNLQCEALLLKEHILSLAGPTRTTGVQATATSTELSIQCDDWDLRTANQQVINVH